MSAIVQSWKGIVLVERNSDDGFVDATLIAKHFNKQFADYSRTVAGAAYMHALQCAVGTSNPIMHTIRGSQARTWIHPRLAIDFARWLDVEFAVWMDGWILKIVDVLREDKHRPLPHSSASAEVVQEITSSTQRLFRNQLVILTEADLHCHLVAETRRTWPFALLVPGIGELPEAGTRRL